MQYWVFSQSMRILKFIQCILCLKERLCRPAKTGGRREQTVLWRYCQAFSMVKSSFWQKYLCQPPGKLALHRTLLIFSLLPIGLLPSETTRHISSVKIWDEFSGFKALRLKKKKSHFRIFSLDTKTLYALCPKCLDWNWEKDVWVLCTLSLGSAAERLKA